MKNRVVQERELLQRLKMGDNGTFNEIYKRYQKGVLDYVYRLSGFNQQLAEDVAQEVFLNLWKSRNDHDPAKPPQPLLLTMARNTWINASKRESIRKTAPLHEETPSRIETPYQTHNLNELEITVDKSLGGLNEPIREVFVLSRYHGLKYSEIAQMLGISIKTVEARLSEALDVLCEKLKTFVEE